MMRNIVVLIGAGVLVATLAAGASCELDSGTDATVHEAPLPVQEQYVDPEAVNTHVFAEGPEDTINLDGPWHFRTDPSNFGMSKGWNSPKFDDAPWRMLQVPGAWEDQGVTERNLSWTEDDLNQHYTGYAWYRRTVSIPAEWKGKEVFLNVGYIDDHDWTYFNGRLVGQTTTMAEAADQIARSYVAPQDAIRFGEPNLIAVRVLDRRGLGGLKRGPLTITTVRPQNYASPTGYGERVEFGRSITVSAGETVGDVVAIGGTVTVIGHVTGDAVAVGGSVRVKPGGRVDGDVVSVGGRALNEGGLVSGSVTNVGALPEIPFLGPFGDWFGKGRLPLGFIGWGVVGTVLLTVLLVAVFPLRMKVIADTALDRPGLSVLWALGGSAVALAVAGLLMITCIGIPLVGIEMLFGLVMFLTGVAGVRLAIGTKIGESFGGGIHAVAAALVGAIILGLVAMVPVLGWMIVMVFDFIGFGAALLTGMGSAPDWVPARFGNRPPAPATLR